MASTNTSLNHGPISNERIPAIAPAVDLQTLARQQGVSTVDFDRLLARGGFWPEDETVADFLATLERWRSEEEARACP